MTHYFIDCKLRHKQSGKVPHTVLLIIPEKPWIRRYVIFKDKASGALSIEPKFHSE